MIYKNPWGFKQKRVPSDEELAQKLEQAKHSRDWYYERAAALINGGYPVPTNDIEELAKMIFEGEKKLSQEEKDKS